MHQKKGGRKSVDLKTIQELLEDAYRQPGIKEMMGVFSIWREIDEISRTQSVFAEDNLESYASSTSDPVENQL